MGWLVGKCGCGTAPGSSQAPAKPFGCCLPQRYPLLLVPSRSHIFWRDKYFFPKPGNQCGHTGVKSILLYLLVGLVIMEGQTQRLSPGTQGRQWQSKGTNSYIHYFHLGMFPSLIQLSVSCSAVP